MDALLKTSSEARDEEWEKAFLHIFPDTNLRVLEESPRQGPDGFPYLMVSIDADGSEPTRKVLGWLADKGIGLVVNPFHEMPDFVLSYGQVWNFKERGEINSVRSASTPAGSFKMKVGQQILSGAPSDEYLPTYARDILREFFKQQGLTDVRIAMVAMDQKNYDLCFSLESLKDPSKSDHRDLLEAISWFLPAHYSLALISEEGLPPFFAL